MLFALLLFAASMEDCLAWSGRAILHYQHQDYGAAEKLWQQALGMPDPVLRAKVAVNLATLYGQTEQLEKAEQYHALAYALRAEKLGNNHVDSAIALSNLANAHIAQGRYRQAEGELQQALHARGLLGPNRGQVWLNLAHLCRLEGRFQEARRHLESSLAAQSDPSIIWNSLGLLAEDEGDSSAARRWLEQSLQHTYRPAVAANLARTELHFGNFERVQQLLAAVLEAPIPTLLRAAALETQAELKLAKRQHHDALAAFRQSLALRERILGPEHPALIPLLTRYAATLRQSQQPKEASRLEQRTRRLAERQPAAPSIDWRALRPEHLHK